MESYPQTSDALPISSLSAPSAFPSPSVAGLQLQFVGKRIQDVQTPAAVLDAAVVRRNCRLMLEGSYTPSNRWRFRTVVFQVVTMQRCRMLTLEQRQMRLALAVSSMR